MAGNGQAGGPSAAAQLTEGISSKPQAPLRPLMANSQQAQDASLATAAPAVTKPVASRKRARPAKQKTQATTSLATDTAAEHAQATEPAQATGTATAEKPDTVMPEADAIPDLNAVAPSQAVQQAANSSKPKAKRKPRQAKAATANKQTEDSHTAEAPPDAAAAKQEPSQSAMEVPAATGNKVKNPSEQAGILADGAALSNTPDAAASGTLKQAAAKPKRKPRQSKAAAAKTAELAVKAEPLPQGDHSASDADMMSDVSATASAANGQSAPAEAVTKPKPKRKPRQTKAQAAAEAAAAAQNGAGSGSNVEPAAAPVKPDRRKRAKIEKVVADVKQEVAHEAAEQDPAVAAAPVSGMNEHKPHTITSEQAKEEVVAQAEASASETSQESAVAGKGPAKRRRAPAKKKTDATAADADAAGSMSDASIGTEGAASKGKAPRKRAPKKAPAPEGQANGQTDAQTDGQPSSSETSCEQVKVDGQESVVKVKKSRRKFKNELTIRLFAAARAALAAPETVVVPPLPVPNLGYACLNTTLQAQKPPVTSNRGAILRTFNEKGLDYISSLALQNCKDLLPIVQWNHEHNIRLFRLSSDLFPWGDSGKYKLEELPDFSEIEAVLAEVGALARLYKQRLTSHPSAFVKLAALKEDVVEKSLIDLENHARVFDMMGFEPSYWNKINIHIGGTYGKEDEHKAATLERFIENFNKLSPSVKKRLAVENDDKPTQWSITDLLPLHDRIGVAVTFDFHHHKFCKGGKTEEEAFKAAIATWPKDVRPQVHWSEEPEDPTKVRHAHSQFIRGPMNLHGHAADVDIMVEAKAKELTVLDFRNTDHLSVELAPIQGTLETEEAVRKEYENDIEGARVAREAVEEKEVQNAIVREQAAEKAKKEGALKFLT